MNNCALTLAALTILASAGCAVRIAPQPARIVPVGRLVVARDSSTSFATISSALDSARDGDTVFVMPGEYHEVVKILKLRHICLFGADPATTVVDASDQYSAVEISTDSNRISGLALKNADSHGIWVRDGLQFIDHCLIVDNGDRGIYLSSFAGYAYAQITHCTVVENGEVGIHAARDDSSTVIAECIIAFNSRGIVTDQPAGKLVVRHDCLFGNGVDFDRVAPGDSNLLQDPRFVNREDGDFHLRKDSPCRGRGAGHTNLGAF